MNINYEKYVRENFMKDLDPEIFIYEEDKNNCYIYCLYNNEKNLFVTLYKKAIAEEINIKQNENDLC